MSYDENSLLQLIANALKQAVNVKDKELVEVLSKAYQRVKATSA